MEMQRIPCYVVTGFLDAGKTTYIQENIFRDFFHKRGDTLILSFEEGEEVYDEARLLNFRTKTAQYEGGESISAFCLAEIEKNHPDRIFVEANAMTDGFMKQLPPVLKICDVTVLIDGSTFSLYFLNMRQQVQNMIVDADMVIFGRCEEKESLASFAAPLRLMNNRCVYLWESPMGYAEQAFGLNLPYDIEQDQLVLSDEAYPIWFLDSSRRPEKYYGKTVEFTAQVRFGDGLPSSRFMAGWLIMTCCAADMQFLAVECENNTGISLSEGDWIHLIARIEPCEGMQHSHRFYLEPTLLEKGQGHSEVLPEKL